MFVLVSTIADEVSINCNVGRAVFNGGAAVKAAVTDIESFVLPKNETVTTADVAVYVSAVVCDAVADDKVTESALIAAFEGTELSTPRPNAATATSAMRLKFVVVDICFLSIVVSKYFLEAALR
jgi:hypothetical protein